MSIFIKGEESHKGHVIGHDYHMWLDGMEDEFALVWNMEDHKVERIQVGYYGSDGRNLMESHAVVDATEEVKRDIIKTLRHNARISYARSVLDYKKEIRPGSNVRVVRGRKAKGKELEVFWVGEKETYISRQYSFMHETETIVGGMTPHGEKVFVKAEYCEVTDDIASPSAKERKKFIENYIAKERSAYGV